MIATTVGIVYSKRTGRVRRVVVPDIDSEIASMTLHGGEGVQSVPMTQYAPLAGLADIQALVTSSTGLTPTADRYVSADASGNVMSAYIADPICGDRAPNNQAHTLVAHASAHPGDTVWPGTSTLVPNTPISTRFRSRNQPLP